MSDESVSAAACCAVVCGVWCVLYAKILSKLILQHQIAAPSLEQTEAQIAQVAF